MDSSHIPLLTPEQETELGKIKDSFPKIPTLIQRTVAYYLEFKSNVGNLLNQQILLAMKCAFFIAQKSQIMQNLKGEKMRGVGLSLNNLIKSHKSDDVIFMLKQMSKNITIKDQQASAQVKNVVEEISLLIKFSDKFQKIIGKLQLKSKNSNPNYQNIFTSLAWLLFVESKKVIFPDSQQIVQNTCLLSHVISFVVIFGWNFIRPDLFAKGDHKLTDTSSQKQVSIVVKNRLFQMFKISNLTFYESVAKQFQIFFNEKMERGIIKHSSSFHFLSPQIIEVNYKKLDQFYNKNMDINGLDHRIFYKERTAIMTPSRFTPFWKQGYLNKGLNKGKIGQLHIVDKAKQNYPSHRVLTYENFDRMEIIDPKAPSYAEITKFPKNIMQSPSLANIPLIQTPLAAGMEMFNYLNNKSKKYNQKNQLSQKDLSILGYIDKFFSKQKKAKTIEQIKKKLVFSLFKTYLSQFIECYPKQISSDIEQALLALILEMVCFVNNIHLEFYEIQAQLQLSVYSEWKICDFLLKSDKFMPIPLKAHILDLEVSFITQRIWLQEDIIAEIQMFFNEQKVSSPLKRKVQKLCARVIFQMAFQINQISSVLNVSDEFSQKVFQIMKNLLEQHINIFSNRFLDQLILCAFYMMAKYEKTSYTLGMIRQAYHEMNPHLIKDHQKLLNVNTPELQKTPQLNLVHFYNQLFLQYARLCLKFDKIPQNVQNNNNPSKESNQVKLLLQSPLKTIIPRETNLLNKNIEANQAGKNKIKSHLTPQLYAYTQSPLLKNQLNTFNNVKIPNNSRKVLDYEKEEAKIVQKCTNKEVSEVSEGTNMDEFFSKKFKQASLNQKSNLQNISPKNLVNNASRGNSFVQPKNGAKTSIFANIQANLQNQQSYHLNIK